MLFFDGAFGLIMLGLWLFCLIDVITTPEEQCRNLPKVLWVIIVLLLADIGSIVWLVAGRNWGPRSAEPRPRPMPGATRPARPTNPDDDEEFLAGLRARAEEQRRRAREAQGRQSPKAEHDEQDPGPVG
jgi:hypothetical protein